MEKEKENPYVQVTCRDCGKIYEIPVSQSRIDEWYSKGTFAQDEFPELTADQRELLISGICPNCWNKLFPPEDEED